MANDLPKLAFLSEDGQSLWENLLHELTKPEEAEQIVHNLDSPLSHYDRLWLRRVIASLKGDKTELMAALDSMMRCDDPMMRQLAHAELISTDLGSVGPRALGWTADDDVMGAMLAAESREEKLEVGQRLSLKGLGDDDLVNFCDGTLALGNKDFETAGAFFRQAVRSNHEILRFYALIFLTSITIRPAMAPQPDEEH